MACVTLLWQTEKVYVADYYIHHLPISPRLTLARYNSHNGDYYQNKAIYVYHQGHRGLLKCPVDACQSPPSPQEVLFLGEEIYR